MLDSLVSINVVKPILRDIFYDQTNYINTRQDVGEVGVVVKCARLLVMMKDVK